MLTTPAPSALAPDAPLDVVLAAALAHRSTGRVEAREGKRKWVFAFVDGQLVSTRSNLKSEQPDAIRAKKPSMSEAAVQRNCALVRMKNAMKSAEAWTFAAERPEEDGDLGAGALLFRAVSGQRTVEELSARLSSVRAATVKAGAEVSSFGASAGAVAAASAWSGQTVSAILAGLGDDAEGATALWLGSVLGTVSLATESVSAAPARSAAAATTPASTGLDIGSLLSGLATRPAAPVSDAAPAPSTDEAAQTSSWAPDKVLLPPEGVGAPPKGALESPPDDFEDAQIEAIGGDAPVRLDASFFEALNQRPDRETVRMGGGMVHSSGPSAAPAPAEAPPVPKHPMEDELRAIAERVRAAPDHFSVLGVSWDDGAESFRVAHRELAQKLHPDRYTDAPDEVQDLATEIFDKVREAWEVLGDETARGAYTDKVIHGKKSEDELAMEQVERYWAAEADFKRGLAAFNAGRLREAHELFGAAVEREPNELEFKAYLGFTTFQTYKTSDPEKAEAGKELLKEVLDKNKDQQRKLDQAWVLLGRIFRDLDNDKGARKCFVQALKLNPSNADATREMRRLTGGAPGGAKKKEDDKPVGFFARLFGRKS